MKTKIVFLLIVLLLASSIEVYGACSNINFSGINWTVKEGNDMGPANNDWSCDTVWVDNDGLHLKIAYDADTNTWYSAEVTAEKSYGYGKYLIKLKKDYTTLNENVVFGFFLYSSDNDEIDIELSRFGNAANNANNSSYSLQPATKGHKKAFFSSLSGDRTSHFFNWQQDVVSFQSIHGHYDKAPSQSMLIQEWTYTGNHRLLPGSERLHINLWRFDEKAPSDGKEVEVVIESVEIVQQSAISVGDLDINGDDDILVIKNSGQLDYSTDLTNFTTIGSGVSFVGTGNLDNSGSDDIYALANDGSIWYTLDLGATWINIPGSLRVLKSAKMDGAADYLVGLSSLVLDLEDPYNGLGEVWYTKDRTSWLKIPGALTQLSPYDASGSGTKGIIGTDSNAAVWLTSDMSSWSLLSGFLIQILTANLDNSGKDDIIGLDSNLVPWYKTDLGSWSSLSGTFVLLRAGDVSGDSIDDIVGVNSYGELLYTTDLGTWSKLSYENAGFTYAILGDLNGDSRQDIIVITDTGNIIYTPDLGLNWSKI